MKRLRRRCCHERSPVPQRGLFLFVPVYCAFPSLNFACFALVWLLHSPSPACWLPFLASFAASCEALQCNKFTLHKLRIFFLSSSYYSICAGRFTSSGYEILVRDKPLTTFVQRLCVGTATSELDCLIARGGRVDFSIHDVTVMGEISSRTNLLDLKGRASGLCIKVLNVPVSWQTNLSRGTYVCFVAETVTLSSKTHFMLARSLKCHGNTIIYFIFFFFQESCFYWSSVQIKKCYPEAYNDIYWKNVPFHGPKQVLL